MSKDTKLKQIKKWVEKWRKNLNLQEWEVNVTLEDLKKDKVGSEYYEADGKSDVQNNYLSAHLTFDVNKDITEDVVLHEIVHLLTAEIFGFAIAQEGEGKKDSWSDYFNERLVTRITRILLPDSPSVPTSKQGEEKESSNAK